MQQLDTQDFRDAAVARITSAMAAGSDDAHRELYELTFDRLYRHFLVLTRGDEHLTRELIQTVFLKLTRYRPVFGSEVKLWAWLKQSARSAHIDWLRRNGKHLAESLELVDETAWTPPAEDSSEELISALERSVEVLPDDERELIRRAYYEHLPQRTLAETSKTTTKAIESKLARIRRKLRAALLETLKDYALL